MLQQKKVEEKYIFFDSHEECAKAAAPVFLKNRWRWYNGLPDEKAILVMLLRLKAYSRIPNTNGPYCCGRLAYYKGRFGYQRPPEVN